MKSIATWKLISESVKENIPVMLLYVLESAGSSPGRQGFAMAVNANGEMKGSLGGGIMEHKFVEMAKAKLREEADEISIHKQVHSKSAPKHQSGMICSGEQTIFLYRIKQKEAGHINNIISCIQQHANGMLQLSPNGIFFEDKLPEKDFHFQLHTEIDWLYTEKIGYKNHLYIIGAGHCALAFSRIMHSMDFYIHLYDDRADLNTMHSNEYVHEKTIVRDYSQLADIIPSGNNNYVVIMTFGYRTDDIAFRALARKKFKYLGMLGSRKKIEKMFSDYKNEHIAEEQLRNTYAPIGLPIKSETPEEIAISIAAEIIQVKHSKC